MPDYSIYGLRLRCSAAIPTLYPATGPRGEVDVDVSFRPLAEATDEDRDRAHDWYVSDAMEAGEPILRIRKLETSGDLLLKYPDGMRFRIDSSGSSVIASCPDDLTIDDAALYLLGPVLGVVLRLRGDVCLHGSVVELDGEAVGFIGPQGAGKSTTAAALTTAGRRVLSDDLLVLRRRGRSIHAEPGYPLLRLWPTSVAALYGSPKAMPRLVPGWEKRYVDLIAAEAFAPEHLPLRAIYALGERRIGLTTAITESLTQRRALLELVKNSYAGRLPGPSARRAEFELFSELTSEIPIRRLNLGQDWASVSALGDVLLAELAGGAS